MTIHARLACVTLAIALAATIDQDAAAQETTDLQPTSEVGNSVSPSASSSEQSTIYSRSKRNLTPEGSSARRSMTRVPYRSRFDTPARNAAVEFERQRRLRSSPINRQLSALRDARYERQISQSFWSRLR